MSREVTAEEIVQFAEAGGWTYEPRVSDGSRYYAETWTSPNGTPAEFPDFLHDLNACFEALGYFYFQWSGSNYQITHNNSGFGISITLGNDDAFEMIEAEGKTLQTAIIRAVNAAKRARQ